MARFLSSLSKLVDNKRPRQHSLHRPSVELLEDRCVPATLSVNSNLDNDIRDNVLTLREAIEVVNLTLPRASLTAIEKGRITGTLGVNDTIVFATPLLNKTITLTTGELDVKKSVTINGLGTAKLAIAGVSERIFDVGDFESSPIFTIKNITLKNGLSDYGGAIANENAATSNVINCVITGNVVDNVGGAIANDYSGGTGGTVLLQGCTITGNTAGRGGGAVYNAGTMKIQSCTISGNITTGVGGGVYNIDGDLTIIGSTISKNKAEYYGGGVCNAYGSTQIQTTTISGNQAGVGGGGVENHRADLTIQRSTISGNTTDGNGGGIDIYNACDCFTQLLQNCTITGNTAKHEGGGIYAGYYYSYEGSGPIEHSPDINQTLTAINCTVAFNTADGAGGGIFASGTLINLFNTIVSDDKAAGIFNDLDGTDDGLFNAQYSLIQTADSGMFAVGSSHNITGVSAQLGPLANNGGPTLTLRPKLTSPVLRAGSLSLLTPDMTTDQRGGPRTAFGTVDIGAIEIVPSYVQRRGWGTFYFY